jgi:response regulator RpfG family c-di-GMP phosphodiesterase
MKGDFMRKSSQDGENISTGTRNIVDDNIIDLPGLPNILIVDDESNLLKLVSMILIKNGFTSDMAHNLDEAYKAFSRKKYDIVFLDLGLPDGSGFKALERAIDIFPETLVVMITGVHDLQTAVSAIRKGAFDYITKPFSVMLFQDRFATVIEEWKSRTFTNSYQKYLEMLVKEKTDELINTVSKIEHVHDTTVFALGAALDLRDPETEEHCKRVSENSIRLGMILGIKGNRLRNPLSKEEFSVVKKHSILGQSMIKNIDFLVEASEVVLYHHEKYEGTGYPLGLRGDEIPLFARIFAIVDAFDAMTNDRPYRKALGLKKVRKELNRCSGTHFDPKILKNFLELPPIELKIKD